jgi:hypothetical protein
MAANTPWSVVMPLKEIIVLMKLFLVIEQRTAKLKSTSWSHRTDKGDGHVSSSGEMQQPAMPPAV